MEKESKRGDCHGFQSLGDEIAMDILSRLSVESIMRCKCVCKAWNSVLNHDYFVKLHLSKSKTRTSSSHILVETVDHNLRVEDSIKRHFLDVENHNIKEIPVYPYAKDETSCPMRHMFVACHLDGLICFCNVVAHRGDPIVIYNPLVPGDYVRLPESKNYYQNSIALTVALGFDVAINKYKVVKIMAEPFKDNILGCEVFTIGKDTSWRELPYPYTKSTLIFNEGVCHQGSIYWTIQDLDNRCILEFDLAKEELSVISFTNSAMSPTYRYFDRIQLHSLGEYLTLSEEENRLAHIWRIVKQNTGSKVVGYKTMKIESFYKHARLHGLVYLNNDEDLLLLRTQGGYEPAWTQNGGRIKTPGIHFTLYRPASEKNNRFTNLPNLNNMFSGARKRGRVWCFKPSLVSIIEAMLN